MVRVTRDLLTVTARHAARRRTHPRTPVALARRLLPEFVIAPTTALISDALIDAITNPDRRYILSTPPRSGKSLLTAVIGPLFALMRDPDANIIIKTYGDELAAEHSRQTRRLITEHHELLGLELAPDSAAVGRWQVSGRRGGLLAGGIMSSTTGFGSEIMIIDDPVKGAAEADSPAYRRRLLSAFQSDLLSRLHPGAGCLIVMSRWHPEDLAGACLDDPDSDWQHINIPAIATAGVPDVLAREPGVPVVSVLGRDLAGFKALQRSVGTRTWNALYLGVPATPEGSLIKSEWLDTHRIPAAPTRPVKTVVAVDPADSGEGDETGIIAASLAPDGRVCLTADWTALLTSDQWANRCVELAVSVGASAIVVEGFSARETYVRLITEARDRHRPGHQILVQAWPPKGRSRVGDALARSTGMIAGLENGRCVIAGRLPELEAAMASWNPDSHQPDAVAASVIAFDHLAALGAGGMSIAAPVDRTRDPAAQLLAAGRNVAAPRLARRLGR